jgi:hypothetical protein
MLTTKTFDSTLVKINKHSDDLAEMIHDAGLYVIDQANTHRNIDPALRFVEALGRKHDKQRVVTWLTRFSILRIKKGSLIAGKNVVAKTEWLEEANSLPYWELTPQPTLKGKLDILASLKGVLNRYESAKSDSSKEWKFYNEDLLKDIQAMIDQREAAK